jgi:L-amino acid N-acyltransferase YncA
MSLTTRPARREDAPAITDIYNQGIEDRIATFEIGVHAKHGKLEGVWKDCVIVEWPIVENID